MKRNNHKKKIDRTITVIPFLTVLTLSILFFRFPEESNRVLSKIRFFFGDTLGSFYLLIGLSVFLVSVYLCVSRYGDLVLGEPDEKPKISFFSWGCMMFTCGLAADLLFYAPSEWVMVAADPALEHYGSMQEWAGVFPVFHWSFIPWSFYLVLACAFGFMIHVRKRSRQKYSESCRALLKSKTDGPIGTLIDLLAVFALLAGTATTFSVATPLMAAIIRELFSVELSRNVITILILLVTCTVYTVSLLKGIRGIDLLARGCIALFFGLVLYVLLGGGESKYIIETGIASVGKMVQHFFELATNTDPLRETSFPQNWTIYYWAYWMVWCVAVPFFIGSISKGRTVRQVIIGGYLFGVGSTILGFVVFGNYAMGLQITGKAEFLAGYLQNGDIYQVVLSIFKTLPMNRVVLAVLLLAMIAFYATSFDSIALSAACYSYQKLEENETPDRSIQLQWCILLILLPIALVFSESSMRNLQSVSIVAAFPIGFVIILIIVSFLKDAGDYLKERENRT